jgi:hypothetical protein
VSKFPSRVLIVAPICCALTGCPPFSDDTPVTTVEGAGVAIPPWSGPPSLVGGVLDPKSSTLKLTNCVLGNPAYGPNPIIGTATRQYSVAASSGISATLYKLLGITLDSNVAKTVTVSADGVSEEGLLNPYRNDNSVVSCDLSAINNPQYVRVAYKATSLTYTINDQAGGDGGLNFCNAVVSASANVKATYTNQVQYTSPNIPVYYEVVLDGPVPFGWNHNVKLNADAESIGPANPNTFVVKGPDPKSGQYTLVVYGIDYSKNPPTTTAAPTTFTGMNIPTPVVINGQLFIVRFYHPGEDQSKLAIQFAPSGPVPTTSTAGGTTSGGTPTTSGGTSTTSGGTSTTSGGTSTMGGGRSATGGGTSATGGGTSTTGGGTSTTGGGTSTSAQTGSRCPASAPSGSQPATKS